MDKKNILIIENESDHFIAIKKSFEPRIGRNANIFPLYLIGSETNLNNNNYLIGKITEGQYKEVFDFHKDIHLYIIDVFLVNDRDKQGLEFARYILNNRFDDFKIIIISNTGVSDELLTNHNEKITFFSKFDRGIKNWPIDLAKAVRNILKIDNLQDEKTDSQPLPQNIEPPQTNPVEETIGYKLHLAWEYIRDNTNRLIDKLIYLAFYVLLIFTTASSMWNIIMTIKGSFTKFHEDANLTELKANNTIQLDSISNSISHVIPNAAPLKDDTLILKSAEHIFLYLLPVFIIFGFFNYYKTNTRITLLDGKKQDNDNENSTKAVNLTKVLFISSIVSYVIIKIIEIVFFKQASSYSNPDDYLTTLISSGVLLLLLMIYFIFLDRKKH